MRRVCKFEINGAYVEPYRGLGLAVFWFSAALFCLVFWLAVIRAVFG